MQEWYDVNDMEDMTNRQIVLLTMLVSFVISTATGIVTVAMLEEAPPTLTHTVNRVVEHTIERVVTGTSSPEKTPAPVTTVTKEVTIYAKEDDLLVAAVEKNQPRVALIYGATQATGTDPLASGFVVSRDGLVVTETTGISLDGVLRNEYRVVIGDRSYVAKPMHADSLQNAPISLLSLTDTKENTTFDAVSFGSQLDPKVAQTVVVLGGVDGSGVTKTTLSKFHYTKGESTTTPAILSSIDTTPKIPDDYHGALVVNLDGQAVGIGIGSTETSKAFIFPASRILSIINAISSSAKQTSTTQKSAATKTDPATAS